MKTSNVHPKLKIGLIILEVDLPIAICKLGVMGCTKPCHN